MTVQTDHTLTEGLWALANRPATDADRAATALHLLDWLGCAIAGAATPTGRAMVQAAGAGPNPFSHAGPLAVTATGGLGSLYEMDDVHRTALLHPGPVVIPAVLALSQHTTGAQVLDAILSGYDAMIRLGSVAGPGHYASFHNTSTCGGIGSATAVARLLNLPDLAAVWAMGHAMSMAGGLWQCRNEPSATKHLHVAEAARRGLQSALWARAGLPAPKAILEGPQGFFAAMARDAMPDALLSGPSDWRLHQVSFKPWPACRHAHPTIDAALLLTTDLTPDHIAAINVRTFADAILFCDRPGPCGEAEAKFSLQHCLAVVFASGPPQLGDFTASRIADPVLTRLRGLVTVTHDPALTAAYPAHFGARVEVTLTDGTTRHACVTDAWGDSERPLTPADVLAKFHALTAHAGLDPALAHDLATTALNLTQPHGPAQLARLMAQITLPALSPQDRDANLF